MLAHAGPSWPMLEHVAHAGSYGPMSLMLVHVGPCSAMPAHAGSMTRRPDDPATCQRDGHGHAPSMSNTCKNAWSINETFKNTMLFNQFGPERSFRCGVVTPTLKNEPKTTYFARKCKPPGPLAPKQSVFTMIVACQNTPVLSLFFHVLKTSHLSGIAFNIGPRDARIFKKQQFLR